MPDKMSRLYEFSEYKLFEDGRMARTQRQHGFEIRYQGRGDHHISQAETRKQNFAETARVQHRSGFVQALHGWNRTPDITEFTVIVVFENQRTRLVGPLKQLQAPRQAHSGTQWKLVSRRYVNQTNIASGEMLHCHPLHIGWDRENIGAHRLKDPAGARIS